jgi:hypothetical protein
VAEKLVEAEDAVGDFVRSADEHHAARFQVGRPARRRRRGAADLGHARFEHSELVPEVVGFGLAVVLGHETVDGDGDVGRVGGVAELGPALSGRAAGI